MGTEAIFHCDFSVAQNNSSWYTTKILEYLNQSIQEDLLVLPAVDQDYGDTTVAKPGTEASHVSIIY